MTKHSLERKNFPPRKLTCQWKINILNRRYIFKWLVFPCHVSFRGCKERENLQKLCCFSSKHLKWEIQHIQLSHTGGNESDRHFFEIGVSKNRGTPNHPFVHRIFPLFSPSILGGKIPLFLEKHPNMKNTSLLVRGRRTALCRCLCSAWRIPT